MELLPYVSYNSSNTDRAKNMRRDMTFAEQIIRFQVLQNRPGGYKFIRQKMISSFILDFYCSKLLLGIEIDGGIHDEQIEYDIQRDEKLRHLGILMIRYKNEEVINNIAGIYLDLLDKIQIRQEILVKATNLYPERGPFSLSGDNY